jgi:isopentenyldiphosphate isomerase
MTRNELVAAFAQGYESLKTALEQTPAGAIDFRPSPGAWTIREIIHHMPDSEATSYVRCRKIIAESGVAIDLYDQDVWTDKLKYRSRDITLALELFRLMRLYTVELLRTVEDSVWANNYVMHPERGKLMLEKWLEIYAAHADKHAAQMRRNIEAWEKAGRP